MSNISAMDYLLEKMGNICTRDAHGNITGVFVKFPKTNSYDLDTSLSNSVHPAFIINGVTQEYIYLGKYLCGEKDGIRTDGALCSLPNICPWITNATPDAGTGLDRVKQAGSGITGMTVADYGFIKLLAQKMGWTPDGNCTLGKPKSKAAEYIWWNGLSLTSGNNVWYFGHRYQCLQDHTASTAKRPDISPDYFRDLGLSGPVCTSNYLWSSAYQCGIPSVNGSGPASFWLNNDTSLMCDLLGNVAEKPLGIRVVNGELQIIQNNDAADPSCDLTDTGPWKAIKPGSAKTSWTLVNPGTSGTIKIRNKSETYPIDFYTVATTTGGEKSTSFSNVYSTLSYTPNLLVELGLYKTGASDTVAGGGEFKYNFGTGTYYPTKSGCAYDPYNANGLSRWDFGTGGQYWGYRARYMEVDED